MRLAQLVSRLCELAAAAARLRHIAGMLERFELAGQVLALGADPRVADAGTTWSAKCYMNMRPSSSLKPEPSPHQTCERL